MNGVRTWNISKKGGEGPGQEVSPPPCREPAPHSEPALVSRI